MFIKVEMQKDTEDVKSRVRANILLKMDDWIIITEKTSELYETKLVGLKIDIFVIKKMDKNF